MAGQAKASTRSDDTIGTGSHCPREGRLGRNHLAGLLVTSPQEPYSGRLKVGAPNLFRIQARPDIEDDSLTTPGFVGSWDRTMIASTNHVHVTGSWL